MKPGDWFSSADAAAFDALSIANPRSINMSGSDAGLEIGGRIYKIPFMARYSYTKGTIGTPKFWGNVLTVANLIETRTVLAYQIRVLCVLVLLLGGAGCGETKHDFPRLIAENLAVTITTAEIISFDVLTFRHDGRCRFKC